MKTKIVIAGIGGVGGFFGGLLAKHFYENGNIEINFFARGGHLKEIQNNGLRVIKGETEFIAKPHIVTDDISDIGIVDYVIIATKSYDLEAIIQQLRPCINQDTIILPLLNGVNSKERIQTILIDNIVLDGCAYIVSRLKQFGVVENIGNIQTLYFGLDNIVDNKLTLLERIFKEANIEATLSENISTIIWEKFIFLSPTATATSYFDKSIGEIISNNRTFETIKSLIKEVTQIAKAKNIKISETITAKTLDILKTLPFEATSSMHNDFKNKKSRTELQTLTGYVLTEGKNHNIATPTYSKLNEYLEKKIGT